MRNRHRILGALLACGISLPVLAAVTASVDRNTVASGETIQLRLMRDGNGDGQPDFAPLRKDFDVLGSSSGSSVQIINGKVSSQTQVTVLLSPRHDGKLQIPPLQWGAERSAAIALTVGGSGGAAAQDKQAASDAAHVFITATTDQKQPYVQAAVVLTVKLYTDQALVQASLDLPASSDVLVKPLGKDTQSSETRSGRSYQTIERKYLLFPQRSGKLSLNGPVLDAQVADAADNDPFDNIFKQMPFAGMMNSTRPLRLHGKPIELDVLARPAGARGANWLPAQKVTLEENWRQEDATIHVGEPLTRSLHLTALGLTGAQLPDPNAIMTVPEGIKAYPDQASVADDPQGNSVSGSRAQNIALIASRPGRYELPPVRLSWWDTVHNEQREATLPAHALEVLPAAAGANTETVLPPAATAASLLPNMDAHASVSPQAAPNVGSRAWQWTSLAFGLLWLGTLLAWWHTRRAAAPGQPGKVADDRPQHEARAGAALKAFKQACRANDAPAARRHLLAWAGSAWPMQPPQGLNELARRLADDNLALALRQLDRACYTGNAWQGDALARSFSASALHAAPAAQESALPELYV